MICESYLDKAATKKERNGRRRSRQHTYNFGLLWDIVVVGEINGDVFGQEPVQCGGVCRVATECSRKEKIGFAQGGLASRRKAKRPHIALLILPPFKKGSVGILLFKTRQARAESVPEAVPAQRVLHARQRPTDWEGSPLVRRREAGEGSPGSDRSWGWILRRAQPLLSPRFLTWAGRSGNRSRWGPRS